MKKLFFLYVWLNLTRIAELRKENLVKHIRKRTIQTGRLFFSSSLNIVIIHSLICSKFIQNSLYYDYYYNRNYSRKRNH